MSESGIGFYQNPDPDHFPNPGPVFIRTQIQFMVWIRIQFSAGSNIPDPVCESSVRL